MAQPLTFIKVFLDLCHWRILLPGTYFGFNQTQYDEYGQTKFHK